MSKTSYKLVDNSKEVLRAKDDAVKKALEMIGLSAEGYAKGLCLVDTGRLRNSITHTQEDEKTEVIATNVDYAPYIEYGHRQTPGRYVPAIEKRLVRDFVPGKPFIKPAVADHLSEYKKIVEQCLKGQ